MSSFEHAIIEVPQHSAWHLFTGTIVLSFGSIASLVAVSWLFL